jgi:hypothetical protein
MERQKGQISRNLESVDKFCAIVFTKIATGGWIKKRKSFQGFCAFAEEAGLAECARRVTNLHQVLPLIGQILNSHRLFNDF